MDNKELSAYWEQGQCAEEHEAINTLADVLSPEAIPALAQIICRPVDVDAFAEFVKDVYRRIA